MNPHQAFEQDRCVLQGVGDKLPRRKTVYYICTVAPASETSYKLAQYAVGTLEWVVTCRIVVAAVATKLPSCTRTLVASGTTPHDP